MIAVMAKDTAMTLALKISTPMNRRSKSWERVFAGAGLGMLVLDGPAMAADIPVRMPAKAPYIQSVFDWTGFYLGGHLGYGRGHASGSMTDAAPIASSNSFGSLFGGVQLGYNHLLKSGILLGVESDLSFPNFLSADDVVRTNMTARGNLAEKIDYVGRLRGRVGYAFDNWLIYGTGGFAWSQARFIETSDLTGDEDKALRTRGGWVLGAGAEVAIAPDWSARLEYLYDSFGKAAVTMPSGVRSESTFDTHTLRLGLNWHLGRSEADALPFESRGRPLIEAANWNVHGQYTLVGQGYPSFNSPYEGPKSLAGSQQFQNTQSATAYVGVRLWESAEFYVNPELMQGFGLSDVSGVAGFPNGEAQKSNFPSPRSNVARAFLRQTFGLGGEQETINDGPNQLSGKQDISRITITAGKFAVPDAFDGNVYANDPRTTFLNWNIYGGGSYDWTMDKLSWTWGGVVELNQKHWALRVGYFLLPVESNSNMFDTHIPDRGQYTAELELRYQLFSQPGKLRFFGWLNHGFMGSYAAALALPVTTPNFPDIALTRQVRTNYGLVANLEQAITDDLGVFSRATWSPGQIEIMGWTDCSESFSLGSVLKGTSWGRPNDRIGVAGLVEGLSGEARAYLAAGGLGILIGDGRLSYSEERILEAYYAFGVNKWTALTFDYQRIVNPGYNADRGPVSVYAARFHAEF